MADEIANFLDIDPIIDEPEVKLPMVHSAVVVDNATDDYEQVRESMKDMITEGTAAIQTLSKLAKESESPRAYEVFANTLKVITDMNKALMDLHKDAKELMAQKEPLNGAGVSSDEEGKVVFVGSTEELQRHLKTLNGS